MKIKSKKVVQTNEAVYDITVPGYENFLVEQGIYVHNCVDHPSEVLSGWCQENFGKVVEGSKDQSDAVAHVVYDAFANPIQTNIMDVAERIRKAESSLTRKVQPAVFNLPKKPMSDREAMQKALALFSSKS